MRGALVLASVSVLFVAVSPHLFSQSNWNNQGCGHGSIGAVGATAT